MYCEHVDDPPCPECDPLRAETGPMKFEDDWTGLFIRGDNAFYFALALRNVLGKLTDEQKEDFLGTIAPLEGLLSLLESTDERSHTPNADVQLMKLFEECEK